MAIVRSRAPTDPEDPLQIPVAPIVEWYRVDATRRILGFVGLGAVAMILGMLAVADLVRAHGVEAIVSGLLGIGCVVLGGAVAIVGVTRALSEERYLALRVDGALFVDGPRRWIVRWEEVEDVRHAAGEDAIVFLRRQGEPRVLALRFAGASNVEIARRAAALRRKALFGLLGAPEPRSRCVPAVAPDG